VVSTGTITVNVRTDTPEAWAIVREHRECGKPNGYDGCYSHWPTPHCRADGMALPCDVMQIAALAATPTPAPLDVKRLARALIQSGMYLDAMDPLVGLDAPKELAATIAAAYADDHA
jgi:hypothetical protein